MKTFNRFPFAVLLGVILFSAASCSVKEDRSGVPVWLVVSDSTKFNPHSYRGDVTFYSWEKGGLSLTQKVRTCMQDLCSRRDEMTVSKGRTWVSFVAGVEDMEFSRDSLLVIDYGSQCDSILVAAETFETYAEEYYLTCGAHRNYIAATLVLRGDGSVESCPYTLHVKGNVCGLNIKSLTPVDGTFLYVPDEVEPFTFRFRLPRQKDYSSEVEIWGRDWGESREVFFGTFKLGEYLRKIEYELDAEDLLPVRVELDFARGAVSVTVADWTEIFALDVTI